MPKNVHRLRRFPQIRLEGDYNSNGTVEQGDLDLVLLNWGEELFNPFGVGWIYDLPSGPVDQGELDKVLLNWGGSVESPGAASVSEPSAAVLCLILSLVGVWMRGLGTPAR